MKIEDHIRLAGVGAHTRSHHEAFRDDETLAFLEAWCVNPELYQDIKIELRRIFDVNRGFFKHTFFIAQFRVYDNHGVMCIAVHRARFQDENNIRIHTFSSGQLCVSLSEDGLITDIVPRPKMNPANGRPVGPKKPLK